MDSAGLAFIPVTLLNSNLTFSLDASVFLIEFLICLRSFVCSLSIGLRLVGVEGLKDDTASLILLVRAFNFLIRCLRSCVDSLG